MHVPDEKRKKLDPKAVKVVFIGCSQERKAYKCYVPSTHETLISYDVVFDELASWYGSKQVTVHDDTLQSTYAENEMQDTTTASGPIHDVSASVSPWIGRLHSHGSQSTHMDTSMRGRLDMDKGKEKALLM